MIRNYIDIECDECGCLYFGYGSDLWENEAESEAKSQGWTIEGTSHYCPECGRERENAVETPAKPMFDNYPTLL